MIITKYTVKDALAELEKAMSDEPTAQISGMNNNVSQKIKELAEKYRR